MENKLIRLGFLFLILLNPLKADQSVVTYDFSGGRFGDNLLSYLHAKWFSYEHGLPLLYKPFPYSSSLVLHAKEIHYRDRALRKKLGLRPSFKTTLAKWSFYSKIPFFSFCYQCPYFPEDPSELVGGGFFSFKVNWKDERFRDMLRELIAPLGPMAIIKPPPDRMSVALHIRDGGGFDQGYYRLELPLKFPPLSFYIDGLKYILTLFPDQPIYCHLFTDAQNPEELVKNIQQSLPVNSLIEFNYRKENNRHDANILEDFFSLFEFQALIRPSSNFSIIPSLLKDYAIVYAPKTFRSDGKSVVIREADIQINENIYQRWRQ